MTAASVAAASDVVYLIGSAESNLVKIGTSINPNQRLNQIQSTSPVKLSILHTIPGSYALESSLHRHFAVLRRHGEWFDFGDSDPIAEVSDAVEQINAAVPFSDQASRARLASILATRDALIEATAKWRALSEERDNVREEVLNIAAALLVGGAPPAEVVALTPFSNVMIRTEARKRGAPRGRTGPKPGEPLFGRADR